MSISSLPLLGFIDLDATLVRDEVFRVRFFFGGCSGIGRSVKSASSSGAAAGEGEVSAGSEEISMADAEASGTETDFSAEAGMVHSDERGGWEESTSCFS